MLKLAAICDAACIRIAIEALNNIHVRLKSLDEIAQPECRRLFGKFYAAALSLDALHISKLRQPVYDFNQMIVRNPIMVRDFPNIA
mgnify:CR=1 FL=1